MQLRKPNILRSLARIRWKLLRYWAETLFWDHFKQSYGDFADYRTWLYILITNVSRKFGENAMKTFLSGNQFWDHFRGHNSDSPTWILLVFELDLRIFIRNIFSKFGEDWTKIVGVIERKPYFRTDGRNNALTDGRTDRRTDGKTDRGNT